MHTRTILSRPAVLGAAALILTMAGSAAADRYRTFRDITVSCSIALTCDIQMEVRDGEATGLGFARAAGPDTPLAFWLYTNVPLREGAITVTVDGREVARLPVHDFVDDERFGRWVLQGTGARDLLAALRDGAAATLRVAQAGAQTFSLSGLVASARYVDELQGRVGARDALETKGTGESAPARMREIERLADIPAGIRGDFEAPDGICSFFDERRFDAIGGFSATLDEGYTLHALPCAEGGAYNQPFAFYADNGSAVYRLGVPVMGEEGPAAVQAAWNIDWDQPTRTLTGFFKGRGIGDCGSYERWVLSHDFDVPAFVLQEARAKDDCDGDYAGGPENWPLLWPVPAR